MADRLLLQFGVTPVALGLILALQPAVSGAPFDAVSVSRAPRSDRRHSQPYEAVFRVALADRRRLKQADEKPDEGLYTAGGIGEPGARKRRGSMMRQRDAPVACRGFDLLLKLEREAELWLGVRWGG